MALGDVSNALHADDLVAVQVQEFQSCIHVLRQVLWIDGHCIAQVKWEVDALKIQGHVADVSLIVIRGQTSVLDHCEELRTRGDHRSGDAGSALVVLHFEEGRLWPAVVVRLRCLDGRPELREPGDKASLPLVLIPIVADAHVENFRGTELLHALLDQLGRLAERVGIAAITHAKDAEADAIQLLWRQSGGRKGAPEEASVLREVAMTASGAHHDADRSSSSCLQLFHVAELIEVAGAADLDASLCTKACKLLGHLLGDSSVGSECDEHRLANGISLLEAILQRSHVLCELGGLRLHAGVAVLQVHLELALELLRHGRRAPHELGVAILAVQELHHISCDLLRVQDEGVCPLLGQARVEAVQWPVAALHGIALVQRHGRQACLEEAVLNARSVAHKQGRSIVLLSLGKGLHALLVVGTDGDRCDVDMLVGHGHGAQVLLPLVAASLGELCHCTHRRRLRRLTAGVGVDLCVKHNNLHVVAAGDGMVNASVANVVGPTVTAKHPHRWLGEQVFQAHELANLLGVALLGLQQWQDLVTEALGDHAVLAKLQPLLQKAPQRNAQRLARACQAGLHAVPELAAALTDVNDLTQSILCIVLEKGVAPSSALARLLVLDVWNPTSSSTPNAAAACCVGHDQSLAKHLRHQFGVRCLAATFASSRELQQGLLELRALQGVRIEALAAVRDAHGVVPVGSMTLLDRLNAIKHGECAHGACIGAHLATCAVVRRCLDAEVESSISVATGSLPGIESIRGLLKLRVGQEEGSDHSVGADGAAHVALDALVHVDDRHRLGHTPLGEAGLRQRHAAISLDFADLQLMSAHGLHLVQNLRDVGWRCLHALLGIVGLPVAVDGGPGSCIVLDRAERFDGCLHGLDVLIHDGIALVLVRLLHSVLQQGKGLLRRQNA
mmetsp:Transcript_23479/g.54458  ORF Transcript_23479/g.54458 Transcript_23479/m.54458 type:complete len:902 (-) Transcript_23479:791-3496(-)